MTKGVILYNRGNRCAVRMLVFLDSLREWWAGPVTLFMEPPYAPELAASARSYGVDVRVVPEVGVGSLIRRIDVAMESPYDLSVYMDTDMMVVGKFDELFDPLSEKEFAATKFCSWMSTQGIIRRRINCFDGVADPALMAEARNRHPAINGGVWSFVKGAPFLRTWRDLAVRGDGKFFIPDEVALQILYPSHPEVGLNDAKFNVSVKYGEKIEDKRIIHFHGKKHVMPFPLCRLWKDRFHKMLDADKAGMRGMIVHADKRLACYLKTEKADI